MNIKNESYVIYIGTKNFTERYYKDKKRVVKNILTGHEIPNDGRASS